MRVLALIRTADDVPFRCRLQSHEAELRAAGWDLHVAVLDKAGTLERLAMCRRAREFDLTYVVRKLLPVWQLGWLRAHAKRLVYDFDDAVYLGDRRGTKVVPDRMRLWRFRWMMQACDAVTAPTRFLCERAALCGSPERTHHFPNHVDPARYPLAEHRRSGRGIRLAWIGSRSTTPSLEEMRPALEGLPAVLDEPEFRIIADAFPDFAPLKTVACPWSAASEAADLADCDIGLNWLPNHPWSLGKASLKVLQYFAAGLPVVANRLGVNAEYVTHGVEGFLVNSQLELREALVRLANDPDLRRRMGAAGRARLERDFNGRTEGKRLAGLFDRLVGRKPNPPSHPNGPSAAGRTHTPSIEVGR